jgi:DNA-binding response OmpR family regulator
VATKRNRHHVLVVDDEPSVADAFAAYLEPSYSVEAVYSGPDAVASLDAEPDVVLLDRRMPDMHGDAVLEEIRERGVDPRVAMVTAVEPDFDVVEMPFDDYLVKPVGKADLLDAVEGLVETAELDETKRELSSLKIKRNVLEIEKRPRELAEHDTFQRLEDRIERLEADLAALEARAPGGAESQSG